MVEVPEQLQKLKQWMVIQASSWSILTGYPFPDTSWGEMGCENLSKISVIILFSLIGGHFHKATRGITRTGSRREYSRDLLIRTIHTQKIHRLQPCSFSGYALI
jgi:hypothetical protein